MKQNKIKQHEKEMQELKHKTIVASVGDIFEDYVKLEDVKSLLEPHRDKVISTRQCRKFIEELKALAQKSSEKENCPCMK